MDDQLRVTIGRIIDVFAFELPKAKAMDRVTLANKAIDEIHAAFRDAGYRHNLAANFWSKELEREGYMTGQEWYDRFWSIYNEDRLPMIADSSLVREQVDRIAKRASGLTETKEDN